MTGDDREAGTGARTGTFTSTFARQHEPKTPAFLLSGQRVTLEYLQTLRDMGMEWMSHHTDFVHKSGVSPGSNVTRAHRRISEALQSF